MDDLLATPWDGVLLWRKPLPALRALPTLAADADGADDGGAAVPGPRLPDEEPLYL